jgi:hypothetical protein
MNEGPERHNSTPGRRGYNSHANQAVLTTRTLSHDSDYWRLLEIHYLVMRSSGFSHSPHSIVDRPSRVGLMDKSEPELSERGG